MRLVPRSPLPVVVLMLLIGAAAIGHWLYWLLLPATGWDVTDSANGAVVFLFAPSALAGVLLVIGGGTMLLWRTAGRVIGTVGLGLAILNGLYWESVSIAAAATCTGSPGGCVRAWYIVVIAAVAVVLAIYLVVAVWVTRRDVHP